VSNSKPLNYRLISPVIVDVEKAKAKRLNAVQATLITDSSFVRVNFDTVAGLTEAKQTLKEAILFPALYPHLFTGKLACRILNCDHLEIVGILQTAL